MTSGSDSFFPLTYASGCSLQLPPTEKPKYDRSNVCVRCKVNTGNIVIRHVVYCKLRFYLPSNVLMITDGPYFLFGLV